jgi:hypothetical protein
MPVVTRGQSDDQEKYHWTQELNALRENINIAIVKELNSRTKRVFKTIKIQISNKMFNYLGFKYNLKYSSKPNETILDDLRIVRANFSTRTSYARAVKFSFAIRRGRAVLYQSFKEGKLVKNYLKPSPSFVINFFRDDKVLKL